MTNQAIKAQPASGIKLESAQEFLDRVISELRALSSERKGELLGVLEYLSLYIRRTRQEVSTLRPQVQGADLLSSTADELEEILTETARAANAIMEAAESIEAIAAKADAGSGAGLLDAVTRIYEASAFQDITGQRITKVVRALQHIEGRIGALVEACSGGEGGVAPHGLLEEPGGNADADLLNGPQLGKNANSQSEIDRLFGD